MTDAERLFYAIVVIGIMLLIALQLPGSANLEPCRGLPMADCGELKP